MPSSPRHPVPSSRLPSPPSPSAISTSAMPKQSLLWTVGLWMVFFASLFFVFPVTADEAAPPPGQKPASWSVEAFAGPDGENADLDSWGLRITTQRTERWGWQIGLGQEARSRRSDADFIDVSALFRFVHEDRFEVFTYGGFGIIRFEEIQFNFGPIVALPFVLEEATTATMHLGLAFVWNLTDRLYVRPDVKFLRGFGDLDTSDNYDVRPTVAVGWRF